MALLGFSHIGIAVSDLDRSVRFYCDVLGFAQLYALDFEDGETAATMEQEGTFRSAMLLRDDLRLEVLQWVDVPISGSGQRKPMTERGFTHLSFRVDDIHELTGEVLAAGGTVLEHTVSVLGTADQQPRAELIYILDPDGIRIELMANVPDLSSFSAADVAALTTLTAG